MGVLNSIGSALPVIGGFFNAEAQRETNRDNWHNQQTMFGEQTQLANTAHQREVTDLKAAGLNPILSAGGGGSQTPSGGSSTMVAPQLDMPGIIQAQQFDKKLAQDQQRIDIEKANSAAGIVKNLNSAELDRVKSLTERQGALGRYFGVDRAKTINQSFSNTMQKTIQESKRSNPLMMKQPSSGGNLP